MYIECYAACCTVLSIHRDIPMPLVTSGVEHGNLRELAMARMKDLGSQVSLLLSILYTLLSFTSLWSFACDF